MLAVLFSSSPALFSSISTTLLFDGRSEGEIWMHHKPMITIFLTCSVASPSISQALAQNRSRSSYRH
uniref:Uncharacterized protein n=1 Tax=Arundo donax TaxID=35708 RepID=A0A0A8ZJY6_ARUDO